MYSQIEQEHRDHTDFNIFSPPDVRLHKNEKTSGLSHTVLIDSIASPFARLSQQALKDCASAHSKPTLQKHTLSSPLAPRIATVVLTDRDV